MSWRIDWDGVTYDVPQRDSQRQRVYDAEHLCFHWHRNTRQLRNLSLEQLQMLTDGLWESEVVKGLLRKARRRPDQRAPEVRLDKANARWARGCAAYIKLPPWALNIHTVIHEVAHAIAPLGAKHNWMFAAVMLELVEEFMGLEWRTRLELNYENHGVRFAPRKDQISKDTWAVAADRR